jgi:hypothetical protein
MRHIDIFRKKTQQNKSRFITFGQTYHELPDTTMPRGLSSFVLIDN